MKLRPMTVGTAVALLLLMGVVVAGCSDSGEVLGRTVITGSGNVISETREVGNFTSVHLDGIGRLVVEQGDTDSLTIEADDNILPYLKAQVEDQVMVLGFADRTIAFTPRGGSRIVFHVSVRSLEGVGLSGAGKAEIGPVTGESLRVEARGAGDIELASFEGQRLQVVVNGGAKLQLSGKVDTQSVEIEGAGNYAAEGLQSQTCSIEVKGAGNARVWAEGTLNVEITGAGLVQYKGSPQVTKNITGAGSVRPI